MLMVFLKKCQLYPEANYCTWDRISVQRKILRFYVKDHELQQNINKKETYDKTIVALQ